MQRRLLKKFTPYGVVLTFLLLLSAPASLLAQLNTGKIEGTVRDKDTGAPLAGAQVTVEGTRLGNLTNTDGYYFILNVPPGRRSITFVYTGYQKITVTDQLILAGQTTTLDALLSSTVVELEGITVEAEAEPLVPRDNTVSKQRITTEEMQLQPSTRLEDVMIREAGVQIGGEGGLARGLRIRGGRAGEEAMLVDGITVRNYTANPFRMGTGWAWEYEHASLGEDATPLEFSTAAVEEVDIITGGFQAEYGNAQSGIVNIVTKEGGTAVRGNVRMTTDELNPRTADYGYNQLQANIGGPVFNVPNLFFHTSGEMQGQADMYPTHADEGFRGINQDFVDRLNYAVREDPVLGKEQPAYTLEDFQKGREYYAGKTGKSAALYSPPNPVRHMDNFGDRTLVTGKLSYSPTEDLKFITTGNFSRNQRSWGRDLFFDGTVTPSVFPYADWARYAPDTTFQVPTLTGRRTRTTNALFGVDWDFFRSAERHAALQVRLNNFRSQDINNATIKQGYERNTFMSWSWHDLPFEVETFPNRQYPQQKEDFKLFPNGLNGWPQGGIVYETPFRVNDNGDYHLTYRYLRENQYNYKADLDYQFNRQNRAKLGVQYTIFSNRKFNITGMGTSRDFDNEYAYKPRIFAAYIQNRTDLGDFVFDYGLRFDAYHPETNWGLNYGDQYGQNYFIKNMSEWSPRFNVAFPVTDKAQVRFSYGVFSQLPSMDFLFSSGNKGDLGYSLTEAFETGLSYLLTQDLVLDIVSYYRDVTGNVAEKSFFRDYMQYHSGLRIRGTQSGYTNRDIGNIKGMDLTLRKRFSNNFAFNLMYTLQFSRTTGSAYNSTQYLQVLIDAATGESYTPPDELCPIDRDVTHNISCFLNYMFPEDFKAGTWANSILKNFRAYTIFTLHSGYPLLIRQWQGTYFYDEEPWLTRRGGRPIGGLNYFRDRWKMNIDLRLSKSFMLGGTRRLVAFGEIYNLLNRKEPQAYPKGLTLEQFRGATGGVDLKWDDALSNRQKALFTTNFNQDDVLTIEEAAKGEIAKSMMGQNWEDWGLARQIRLGLDFSF
ncbi:MAG TPA: TonB-dependent receptor [archaeon]|nr:TonB-dependent receptor [archaeon]